MTISNRCNVQNTSAQQRLRGSSMKIQTENRPVHKLLVCPYLDLKLQLGVDGVHHFCALHCTSTLVALPHNLLTHTQTHSILNHHI